MKRLLIGNWKMNPDTIQDAREMFTKIRKKARNAKNTEIVIAAPYLFLDSLSKITDNSIQLAAQDCFYEEDGAYTSEISPYMLQAMKIPYVILGHSEVRRRGDTDAIINKKILAALDNRLRIVLCLGEKERDEQGDYLVTIQKQVVECLVKVEKSEFSRITIAYEPVWAIGKNAKGVDTPEDFRQIEIFIRKVLSDTIDKTVGAKTRIIYGGSANADNAEGFLVDGKAMGLLPGRASLDPKEFSGIIDAFNNHPSTR